ncbi:nicotinate-nucleotide--dimethylbenzimidazole phosphoribosyltransferase [Roseococcus suduntuyensis]|uniref:Nicotinate-nucleotide--dimethylbenzimidazole phosphoribosyltransferase n=1 Tax=Roseococcus suduntuyensis TaxID=455361 RepID=A0A840AGT2_9PROT|nr:nicotinate-nucleotide--dimethylbenzimidazole phosphoribosyltransferase [Roseococcus suduntuyensis]MBB3899756.1 nicotinate-nucleotide--dimethylbenzimidazole phosphoribosyltransferase [Roseococcus suduntuyensis]
MTTDAKTRLDALAKPPGSLGKLERLALRLAATQGRLDPRTRPRRLVIFAGDHGVVADGVGLWPSAVTGAMMRLMREGRSSASALGRAAGAEFLLVDAGSLTEGLAPGPGFLDARVGRGTASLAHGPAMSVAEFDAAWALGARVAAEAAGQGIAVLALGEMGIGNTTAAAALGALLTGEAPEAMVGPGAGASPESLARKRAVVAAAVARARAEPDHRAAIAGLCGYEIAALAGCIAEGSRHRLTVVLDGLIVGAAALVAQRLHPGALDGAIAAHVGAEPGHARMLATLGLEPFLDWELRLGEGSGAALLLPLLDGAAALLTEVATLAEVTGG